jgi:NTP pyrophosphatase (non-canonical NTP hydrolase)
MDIKLFVAECHTRSKNGGWWTDPLLGHSLIPPTGEETHPIMIDLYFPYVIGTKIALVHSEMSEALEGYRTDAMDDKLPQFSQIGVELADAMIRIGDLAGVLGIDLEEIIKAKFEFNASRPDHQLANRRKPGGKKF